LLPMVPPLAGAVIVGIAGGTVSTATVVGRLGALVFPAGSVVVALRLCEP